MGSPRSLSALFTAFQPNANPAPSRDPARDPFLDRIAFVTGAASGIGLALTRELTNRGTRVIATDIAPSIHATAGAAGAIATFELDVRDAARFATIVENVESQHGPIDLLFNNAGIGIGGEVQHLTLAHWARAIDVNVWGVIHGIAALYPRMVNRRHGIIINTASTAGLLPGPLLTPYAMSKHAVVGLTRSLRVEARAYGIQVNALCPAAIETPILDSSNPPDLPRPPALWPFSVRRYVMRLGDTPYPADACARDTLVGIERNDPVILVPAKARLGDWMMKLAPWRVEAKGEEALAAERAERGINP